MAYVYLLKSLKDGNQYIGSTINVVNRLKQHNNGEVHSTKFRRPMILKGYQLFNTINEAAYFEKKYKKSHDILLRAIKNGLFKINNGV